jgi:hypothetical protein
MTMASLRWPTARTNVATKNRAKMSTGFFSWWPMI